MKSLENKSICIVGGAGFIGHHLALYLKEHGAEVTVIDGLNVNNLLYLHSSTSPVAYRDHYIRFVEQRLKMLRDNDIPLHVIDARDYGTLGAAIAKSKANVVIMLAAVAHADRSNKNPFNTFDHSLRTLENSLDASRSQIEHFIYFSSSMVYGNFPPEGVAEETPTDPIGIYGNLKKAGEQMVKAYKNVFDLDYTIVRPSALYGERCVSGRVGQIFIENLMNKKPLVINGQGEDRLDFTYIQDLCHGVECVIKNKNARNETFNITYGESRSLKQMVDIIQKHFANVQIEYKPKDSLTPDRGTLLVDKARKMIGYSPSFPLEKAYPRYIQWYKENWHKMI